MRRSTIIYVLLLALTIGAYYYLKNREAPAEETPEIAFTFEPAPEIEFLFPANMGSPIRIRLEAKTGEVVELARNEENAWVLIQPLDVAAEQYAAEAAMSQVVTIQVMEKLSGIAASDIGLDAPEYTLTVTFEDNVQRIVRVGVVTPSGTGYYALVENEIVIISKSAMDALIGLIANPPYAETLTPSPTLAETETPLPASETPVSASEPAATLTPVP
jgi:hypothetical protein